MNEYNNAERGRSVRVGQGRFWCCPSVINTELLWTIRPNERFSIPSICHRRFDPFLSKGFLFCENFSLRSTRRWNLVTAYTWAMRKASKAFRRRSSVIWIRFHVRRTKTKWIFIFFAGADWLWSDSCWFDDWTKKIKNANGMPYLKKWRRTSNRILFEKRKLRIRLRIYYRTLERYQPRSGWLNFYFLPWHVRDGQK